MSMFFLRFSQKKSPSGNQRGKEDMVLWRLFIGFFQHGPIGCQNQGS